MVESMEEIVILVFFVAIVIYIVLGNYLYFAKILPTLDEAPKFLPSGQLDDADRFLQMMNERGEHQWYVPLLRVQRKIAIGYIFMFAIVIAFMVF